MPSFVAHTRARTHAHTRAHTRTHAHNFKIDVVKFNGAVIDVVIPNSMTLEVTQTDTGLKGNTAKGGGTKPATLETGLELMVPLFIETGEKIKVSHYSVRISQCRPCYNL
jgi:hypothetical protein